MDDRSGIISFCLGLTVIVLASVALSMAVEKRFMFSDAKGELEKEIDTAQEEIRFLRTMIADASERYDSHAVGLDDRVRRTKALLTNKAAIKQRRADLERRKILAEAGIESVKDQHDLARAAYRKTAWQKALGERLPELRTRDGQEYRQVVIAKVTGTGMEVRHEHGYARLSSEELSEELQERFQWDRR